MIVYFFILSGVVFSPHGVVYVISVIRGAVIFKYLGLVLAI
jgi:hypothetical protein